MATKQQSEREDARVTLREILPPGSTVYTVLRHVSRSGMSRDIDAYVIQDGEPRWISRLATRAAGLTFNKRADAIRMGGVGMDMGFALVYALSQALYPDGFECIEDGSRNCPSNDHVNRRDWAASSEIHKEGGYALRQRWM